MLNPNQALAQLTHKPQVHTLISLIARILLANIFITSGWGKLTDYQGTLAYMQSMQVSGALLPLVIFAELGGGLAVLLGFQTRLAALGLAVFCVLSAILFHVGGADAAQQHSNQINFMKNFAMAGGFLLLMLLGAGRWSVDHEVNKSNIK